MYKRQVNMSVAWGISDMLNGLMAIPNLIAVLCLRKKVFAEVREYSRNKSSKKKKLMINAKI